jgi:3-hydroxyacyl-CoA dehydrogenase
MPQSALLVRRAAVLGAGVMGAQIAAHLANANVPVVLFDLPAKEGNPSGIAAKAIDNLKRLEPSPLATRDRVEWIQPANYDQNVAELASCDLVIEAIAERLDWKRDLYAKVAAHVAPHAVFASNTSGLSIAALAEACPESLRPRFCGVHFFNPPRYMHLVELIPHPATDPALLDALETFLVTTLGKGVVRAKDTPNFVANRIGVFSMTSAFHHTAELGLGFDEVDAITGPAIGRAKSATYRTLDVVGLDTLAHVIRNLAATLPDDPWHRHLAVPPWLDALIAKGALGQKTRAGIYTKAGKDITVLDVATAAYRPSGKGASPAVEEILKIRDPGEKLAKLRESPDPQAQFLWRTYRDVFHYSAYHLATIADNARDADLAIRWGFGWQQGPFEIWQAAGWKRVAQWIDEDIRAGRTMADAPLPAWVGAVDGVHAPEGSYSPARDARVGRSALPVYRRQVFPETVIGERRTDPARAGTTLLETDALRMWRGDDEVAIVSFKSKMNAIGDDVLDGLNAALDEAERNWRALVIWQTREPFSAGANLASLAPVVQAGKLDVVEKIVDRFQRTSMRLRYSLIPTVAAVRGMALGGGCEFTMHCDRTVAALESYIGLVEVGVGLLPAGGGCKEFALRAARAVAQGPVGSRIDQLPFIRNHFQTIAMATVAKSALEAKDLGFLREADVVVFNAHELLHVARAQASAMAEAGYRPPLPARSIPVVGKTGIGALMMMLVNMRAGGFISEHDYQIGSRIARVLCGGEVESGSTVDEQWLLDLERAEFMALLANPKTQARVAHMLQTGKPLRN